MSRRALVIGVLAAALIVGCGDDEVQHQAGGTSATTKSGSDLLTRSLIAGELKGFEPTGSGDAETDARAWLRVTDDSTIDADAYAKRGFVAGFKRDLQSPEGIPGQSLVVQFKTSGQATAEVTRYRKAVSGSNTTPFTVPGLTGAKGFTVRGATVGDNVAFSKGSYFYAVGRVRPDDLTARESRGSVIAAAKALYARVPA